MKNLKSALSFILILLMTGCASQHSGYSAANQKSNQPFTDSEITAKVKSSFISQKLFTKKDVAAMTIHVETTNGVVYLTGTAENQAEARNAVRIARSVQGVVDVEPRISIR